MKRVVAILLAVVMVLSLAACGGGNKKKSMDFVTNSDGSRTWYNTGNNHIVRIPN